MAKVPDTPENMSKCLCGGCPSYPGGGAVFCAKGKSDRTVTKRGCMCPECKVFSEYSLADGYYCVAGAAGEGAN